MWVRKTMWVRAIELGQFDHWVITTRPSWRIKHWLDAGLLQVPQERASRSLQAALANIRDDQVPALWQCLFPYRTWHPQSVWQLQQELRRAACDSIPHVIVLERLIERGFRFEPIVWNHRPLPPRTQTDHFIVVEAVDADERPIHGLRLELLIADGEIKSAQTDRSGVARIERIQAGRVVIRAPDLDGTLWRPIAGEPARPSGADERLRWHTTQRGECLSRIAHRYGLPSWTTLWEHPKNARLRNRRKSPHVLYPGDQVAIPCIEVHEIVRPTDETHRIEVAEALVEFRVILQDHNQLPYRNVPYELHVAERSSSPTRKGTTDHDGGVVEQLSAATRRVEVFLPGPRLRWSFELGALLDVPDKATLKDRPDDAMHGFAVEALQTRLLALGFPCGLVDGKLGPRTFAALSLWRAQQLKAGATGEAPEVPPEEQALDHAQLAQLDAAFEVVT